MRVMYYDYFKNSTYCGKCEQNACDNSVKHIFCYSKHLLCKITSSGKQEPKKSKARKSSSWSIQQKKIGKCFTFSTSSKFPRAGTCSLSLSIFIPPRVKKKIPWNSLLKFCKVEVLFLLMNCLLSRYNQRFNDIIW